MHSSNLVVSHIMWHVEVVKMFGELAILRRQEKVYNIDSALKFQPLLVFFSSKAITQTLCNSWPKG